MRTCDFKVKVVLKAAALVAASLLLSAGVSFGQQVVNLTAGSAGITLPDGAGVPMWGYSCGASAAAVTSSTSTTFTANGVTDSTGAMVANAYIGYTVTVTVVSGTTTTTYTGTVASNTTTALTLTAAGWTSAGTAATPPNGSAFAIAASTAGCAPLNSRATGGYLGAIAVVNGGSGYTAAPTVTITPAAGNTPTAAASAVANIQNGQVVSVSVTNPGMGYTSAPTVSFSSGAATATAGLWWSPVVITVPSGQALTINLTNNLYSSLLTSTTAVNPIPTSIMIVGQVGGGLGSLSQRTTTPSPGHANAQGCVTWFIANTAPGVPCTTDASGAAPPVQGPRVQSFATEVPSVVAGSTTAPTSLTWSALRPGTYLLESATHPSIQVPMGLIGMLVVTTAPSSTVAGTAYPGIAGSAAVTYAAEVPLEFSEIDPVQNAAVNAAVNTSGFSETMVWDGHTGACGDPSSTTYHQCYPPAVNYTPFYYLINGVAFSKPNVTASVFSTIPVNPTAGSPLLVRLVNAGLRMHVPSIVGSQTAGFTGAGASATVNGFTLIAEDGNPVPGVLAPAATTAPAAPRVQNHVFMPAGKTYDVMVNAPGTGTPDLPIYDRELSLSANSSERDAGMLAYIAVTGSTLPATPGAAGGVFAVAAANPDTYNSLVSCTAAPCVPLVVSDVSKGVIANDINVYGVAVQTQPAGGVVTLNANGTFTYIPNVGTSTDTFTYCANGTTTTCALVTLGASTLTGPPTTVALSYTSTMATFLKIPSPGLTLGGKDPNGLPLTVVTTASTLSSGTLNVDSNGGFTASVSGPGTYTFSYQLKNSQGALSNTSMVTLTFPTGNGPIVNVVDAQAYSNCSGDATCIAGLAPISDYRWIIEEDKTFWVDPNCTTNSSITTAGCPTLVGPSGQSTVPAFAVNFHTSNMDFVAQGCTGALSCEGGQTFLNPATGTHDPAVCDVGNGACRLDTTGSGSTAVMPNSVHLDPSKRYFISVLPGDAGNPFPAYTGAPGCSSTTGAQAGAGGNPCGHTMSGAPIPPACNIYVTGCNSLSTAAFAPVTVKSLPTPLPTGKLSVIVFEDDFPLNGEQDSGGGVDVLSPQEPGLGGFNLVLWDTYGGLGDVTGQDTYDMFNMPLSNSLAGTIDPSTNLDACPISANSRSVTTGTGTSASTSTGNLGITGMIVTCPKYESDGKTLSPLAGQAVIANLMPEKFSVQAYPGADRIARGEEWIQTNTLDGQHPHDSFIRVGEPSYFQEYGPAGYHVAIGFANPAIINARASAVCAGAYGPVGACTGIVKGQVNVQRQSRTPDQRLYPSGSHDALTWTQCWASLGDPDAEDFMFTKCDANGNFQFNNVPGGNWRITIGDQWNDQIIDGLSTPANVVPGNTLNLGNIGIQQWQANMYTRTFIDDNHNGIWDAGEIGIPLIYTRIRYRDGHNANSGVTDFNGIVPFNETFPLFNWYVVESDYLRYKTTGTHVVYDAGGPADTSSYCGASGARACGTSTGYSFLANTYEGVPLPADLSVPGAVYCAAADCASEAGTYFQKGLANPSSATASTGRIDPPWVQSEGWSGETSQGNWIDFGKAPYASCALAAASTTATPGCVTGTTWGENGGIHGFVAYVSTRPFDDASQMIQQPWEPNVPHVTINLYQEGFAADGVTATLKLVDTTQTSSWDDWAQGFYPNSTAGGTGSAAQKPYMNCPGQGTATGTNADLFYYTLFDQPNYLDWYNSIHSGGTTPLHPLPYNSQYKCYDAMHIWNQLQPAPIDGRYSFPSVLGIDPNTGKQITPAGVTAGVAVGTSNFTAANMSGTNCTICVPNPTHAGTPIDDSYDPYRAGTPMLPPGKYVVEVIMPPGYELYKEEDKNLLIGDNYIAPATQQFAGVGGSIFIIPDQASVASLYDTSGAGFNPTNYQNSTTGLGLAEELSGVPGFPGFQDPLWPCVGEKRIVPDYLSLFPHVQETAPFAGATRPLCDRKEVILENQLSVNAKFAIFTSTHIASKFTGTITDDFTSEFDPFSPQFGEKFAPPNLSVSTKDYLGNEISRVYSDQFGIYDGLTPSSWEVNPPNITGYSPNMLVQCMNDPGPILDTRASSPTFGQKIIDPLYNPAYSQFCYEEPYMPGLTTYLDTPVVPTQAFVGAGYNNVDCSYPDLTPAISEVDSVDGLGPWVSAAGHNITINALGDQTVNNYAYSGPSTSVAPFNSTTVSRHYGFGTQCTSPTTGSATCNTQSTVKIGGALAQIMSWSDTQIVATVPNGMPGFGIVPPCTIQQQSQYQGTLPTGQSPTALCGELVITAGNGKQSVDAVTVTVGGKTPTHVPATGTIQSAIDAAAPGDLIIVDPTCTTGSGTTLSVVPCTTTGVSKSSARHNEMVLMWKPVRLQGVGAASTIIDATTIPAGKQLDPWRRHVNCLFGLTLQGVPYTNTGNGAGYTPGAYPYDPAYNGTAGSGFTCPDTGWSYFMATPNVPQIDRLPLEATVGWDASLSGNLAELLQEPTLMGAFEGAGITVLAKGLDFHGAAPWSDGTEPGAFPTGTTLLTGVASNPGGPNDVAGGLYLGDLNPLCTDGTNGANRFPSNFICNPSSIDGLTVTDSSQGGGGIFIHGWAHYLQVANNRVYNNAGTLTGGISVGQGEFATPYLQGGTTNAAPGSCSDGTGFIANQHLPYCLQLSVDVHNNFITNNSSIGDELFSATLSGGGGASLCTGNDYYKFHYNWVCGNLSSGEGGGIVHLGEIQYGDIEHNSILFNQSTNPTIPTNGGGIMVMGTPDTDPVCPGAPDSDCPPGLSDGTGPGLLINANLIQGNFAETGSGGGIRLQQVNGTEVSTFPGVYNITAATEAPTVTIRVPGSVPLTAVPRVGDSVTIAGVSVAGYNGTFTVTHIAGRTFQYIGTTPGLATGVGGTFTDTTTAAAAQAIATATDTAPGAVTITSTLSATVGDSVTITGFTGTFSIYNGTFIVTGVPTVGTFTYTGRTGSYQTFTATAAPFPTVTDSNPNQATRTLWHDVTITNNIIVNNVAGWDGAGISLQDALNVRIVNNTIAHNDSLASSGVLTQSIGTPQASAPPGNCVNAAGTASCPQSAGVTSTGNSSLLRAAMAPPLVITCPPGHANCTGFSNPALYNDIIYQNRSFNVSVGTLGTGTLNQQNLISLYNAFTSTLAPNQASTGACSAATYWDLGVRGDTSTAPNSGSGFALSPQYSVLTSTSGYGGGNNQAGNPNFVSQYCNGSRVPPECTLADGCGGPRGFGVPPGIADAVTPNPVFSLAPSATVDEGNNWINVSWGPLSLTDPSIQGPNGGNWGGGLLLGNYALAASSPDIDRIPTNQPLPAGVTRPTTDFFGNPRPDTESTFDTGAVESQNTGAAVAPHLASINPTTGARGTSVSVTLTGSGLTGTSAVNVSGTGVTVSGIGVVSDTTVTATFTISATAALTSRNVTVVTPTGTSNAVAFAVTGPTLTSISPARGDRGTSVNVTLTGTNLTGATAVNAPGSPNITVTNFVAVSATSVTATLNIATATTLGGHNINVTTPTGTTNNVTFTVTGATVAFAGPTPALTTGTANTTTKTGTITVSNTATGTNAGPLTLTAAPTIVKVGTAGGTFSITGGNCASGTVIAAGGNCTITVQYVPGTSTATATAHVTITDSGAATATQTSANFSGN
jgi:hypothetical protein